MIEPRVYPVADLLSRSGPDGQGPPDFDDLVETITQVIEPDSWARGRRGGFGVCFRALRGGRS